MSSLSPYTFGKSRAAVILAELLNIENSERQTTSVTRFLVAQNQFAKGILEVSNFAVRSSMIRMWRVEIKSINLVGLSKKVFTFTKNVAISRTREIERLSFGLEK